MYVRIENSLRAAAESYLCRETGFLSRLNNLSYNFVEGRDDQCVFVSTVSYQCLIH